MDRFVSVRKEAGTMICENLLRKENVPNNTDIRIEKDSLGEVKVPADRLWGAQTQRSLEHFSIGKDLIPPEMAKHALSPFIITKAAKNNPTASNTTSPHFLSST